MWRRRSTPCDWLRPQTRQQFLNRGSHMILACETNSHGVASVLVRLDLAFNTERRNSAQREAALFDEHREVEARSPFRADAEQVSGVRGTLAVDELTLRQIKLDAG